MNLRLGKYQVPIPRLPWVTLGWAVACVAVFLAVERDALAPAEVDSPLADAATYWRKHAYLAAEPEVLIRAMQGTSLAERSTLLSDLRELSYRRWPASDETRRAEQARLDELTAAALRTAQGDVPVPSGWSHRFGFVPSAPRVRGLFAHPFVHSDVVHLGGILILVLLLAAPLELRWTAPIMLGFAVLASGLAAGLHQLLGDPRLPLLGSGGLVAALFGASALRFWDGPVPYPYPARRQGRLERGEFPLPLWSLMLAWAAVEALQLWWFRDSEVAAYGVGHGLTLVAGASGAMLVRHFELEASMERLAERLGAAAEHHGADDDCLEEAVTLRDAGCLAQAFAMLRTAVNTHPEDEEAILAFWDTAIAAERTADAAPCMLRLIATCADRGELNVAARHWCDVRQRVPDALAAPKVLVRLAPALLLLKQRERAVTALGDAIHPGNGPLTAKHALQAIECAKQLDPELVRAAARRALSLRDLPEWRREEVQTLTGDPPPAKAETPRNAAAPTPAVEEELAPPVETPRFSGIKVIDAVPVRLGARALDLRLSDESAIEIEYDKVQAIAAVAIRELGAQPVVVVDLVMNWNSDGSEPLRVVRTRGDTFDPRELIGDPGSVAQAYRVWLDELIGLTEAVPLPDPDGARGKPMRVFSDTATYLAEVLQTRS